MLDGHRRRFHPVMGPQSLRDWAVSQPAPRQPKKRPKSTARGGGLVSSTLDAEVVTPPLGKKRRRKRYRPPNVVGRLRAFRVKPTKGRRRVGGRGLLPPLLPG